MESMNKGILHGAIIFSAMIITYYGIRSMHQSKATSAPIATCVDTQGTIDDNKMALERSLALNKKLLTSYQNEARDFQKLGLSPDSKPIQFAHQKARETAALITTLERQVKKTD